MANDTSGFRSLVEQIQQRDRESAPVAKNTRTRATRAERLPEEPRENAATARSAVESGLPPFLTRRWL